MKFVDDDDDDDDQHQKRYNSGTDKLSIMVKLGENYPRAERNT